MQDDAAERPPGDPERVLAEMDEAAEVDEDLGDGDGDKGEAVERAWERTDGLQGEAPSG